MAVYESNEIPLFVLNEAGCLSNMVLLGTNGCHKADCLIQSVGDVSTFLVFF